MQNAVPFRVYNASAGSGKTFTLVKEYLKILLSSENLFTFQTILAITFTNKAASEMKRRILDDLEELAAGNTTDLGNIVISETGLSPLVLQARSEKVLHVILQNYSAFNITTIDSFTHKIIKSFAFDLGFSLNFEVEMDARKLLSEAIEILISKIGSDASLTNVLIAYSLEKAKEDKSWDITHDLNEFSKLLLNEEDLNTFNAIADKKLSDYSELTKNLKKRKNEILESLQKIGEDGVNLIKKVEINPKDFYRSMLPNHFAALSSSPQKAKFFDQSKLKERIEERQFYSKSKSSEIIDTIEQVLPSLLELYTASEKLFQESIRINLLLKSSIPLAVISLINEELSTLKQDNNIRLHAEFNKVISDNIKEQPAPFIYEKLGQKFSHFFIDEMQDTSTLQWQNLIPLIDNALAQENSSLLLVGDGKQAIYRWRGGKAEQFIDLGNKGNLLVNNPFQSLKEIKQLETNYRSFSEVISFTNSFFQHVSKYLQNPIYSQLFKEGNMQLENSKKGGHVSLFFLEKEEEAEEERLKYPKKAHHIIETISSDFNLGEICILVRKKSHGVAVANYLSEKGIPLVSSETLLLQNSEKVNFCMHFLQYLEHPKDNETLFEIVYFLYYHQEIKEDQHTFMQQIIGLPPKEVLEKLSKNNAIQTIEEYNQLPLYEKMETIARNFGLTKFTDAYLQFFLDVILEKQQQGFSVQEFLSFWEDKKGDLSIVASEAANAVQIMTIHKSKGLEFPVVIFPYDLDIYKQIKPKVWLQNLDKDKFNGFSTFQVPLLKEFKYIDAKSEAMYQENRAFSELDNFNLLYVALTRSVEQLYIITEKQTKEEVNTNLYSGIFTSFLQENASWDKSDLEYTYGAIKRTSIKKENNEVTAVIQKNFISTPWQNHQITIVANASLLWNTEKGDAISYGNVIHEIMSFIDTKKDIEQTVARYVNKGIIQKQEKEKVIRLLNEMVSHTELEEFYKEGLVIYNERELITEDKELLIPDRLVFHSDKEVSIIDYKTGKPEKKHQYQLKKYKIALESLGYKILHKILIYMGDVILIDKK